MQYVSDTSVQYLSSLFCNGILFPLVCEDEIGWLKSLNRHLLSLERRISLFSAVCVKKRKAGEKKNTQTNHWPCSCGLPFQIPIMLEFISQRLNTK